MIKSPTHPMVTKKSKKGKRIRRPKLVTPLVSIIILNYNQKYFPGMCVEAIEKSKTNFTYEIIMVDNNSKDESIDSLRKMKEEGKVQLIESGSNLGYGKGNNLGVKEAKGKYVIISNPDVFVQKDTMQRMVDYMEKYEDIGLMGPRLRYYDGQIQESCRRHMTFFDLVIKRTFLKKLPYFKKRFENYLMHDFDHNQVQDVDLITGAYFIMQREIYNEVKGFDPRYFLFMEDYDLCRKLHQKGYRVVYFPKAEAQHNHKRLSGGNLSRLLTKKIFWIHFNSAIKYFWKWKGVKDLKSKENTR